MHITNFVLKAVFSVAVLGLSTLSFAHNGEDHSVKSTTTAMPMDHTQMKHAEMKHGEMDHSQHSAQAAHAQHMQMMEGMNHSDHSAHMNHQAQPVKDQQQNSTEKQQDKNTQKGDQHAHH